MAKEMYPEFDVEDFINLPNYKIYLKIMIDGKPIRPLRFNQDPVQFIINFEIYAQQ